MRLLLVFSSLLVALVFTADILENHHGDIDGNNDLEMALFDAARIGHLETVQKFLKDNSSELSDQQLNLAIKEATTDPIRQEFVSCLIQRAGGPTGKVLRSAASNDHLETIQYLLREKLADFDYGLLNLAIMEAKSDQIRQEIVSGFIKRAGGLDEALFKAAYYGLFETVPYLLDSKSGELIDNEKLDSAISVSLNDQVSHEIASCLIKRAGGPNEALTEAAKSCHLDTVQYLLKDNSSELSDQQLNLAIKEATTDLIKQEIARYLIERAGGLNKALIEAAINDHFETVQYILNSRSDQFTDRQLDSAISSSKNDLVRNEIARYLFQRTDGYVDKALSKAARNDNLASVQYILKDKSSELSDQQLNLAIKEATTDLIKQEIASYLIERAGDPNEALAKAARNDHEATVHYLLNSRLCNWTREQFYSLAYEKAITDQIKELLLQHRMTLRL